VTEFRGAYCNMADWVQADDAPNGARRWASFSLLWIALSFTGRATAFF
jgi:hypothetical protein